MNKDSDNSQQQQKEQQNKTTLTTHPQLIPLDTNEMLSHPDGKFGLPTQTQTQQEDFTTDDAVEAEVVEESNDQ